MQSVLVSCDRGVATVTLNRPAKRNALNPELIADLQQAVGQLAADETVRVAVLTGSGSAFCAGADIDHLRSQGALSEAENYQDALQLANCLQALDQFPKPLIAKINGSAYGGGIGLIACADVAIGSTTSQFALTEVRLGIVPAVISPYVARSIGIRQARRWFLTAQTLSAATAHSMGLLHQVVEAADLDRAVLAETELLLMGGPRAQAAAKSLLRDLDRGGMDAAATALLLAKLRASMEGKEGLGAFLERRQPQWVAPNKTH
jgi:methylglutaconyl-CoA hydratase